MKDTASAPSSGVPGTFDQTLIDHVPVAVVATDHEARITHWNRAAEEMYGWSAEEAMGRHVLDALIPASHRDAGQGIVDLLRTGRPWRGEFMLQRSDGTAFPAFVTLSPVTDADGAVTSVVSVSVDISERRRTERRLAAQHAVTRALAEATTFDDAAPRILADVAGTLGWTVGLVWLIDRASDTLRLMHDWNDPTAPAPEFLEASRALSFRRGIGLAGRAWEGSEAIWLDDFGSDPTLPRAGVARTAGLHGAVAFPIWLGSEVLGVIEFLSADSTEPDEELLETTRAIGSQIGQFIERTEAEAELRTSEARKAAVLDAALDAVVGMDAGGLIVEFNPAAEDMFGLSADRAVGQPMAELLVPPHLRERHRAGLARYLATGESHVIGERMRLEAQRADGSLFPIELAITRVDVPGPPLFTAYLRDVTEVDKAEQQLLEAEERYRTLVENTPVVSYTNAIGDPSTCIYISPQIEALTGYTADEWMAEPGMWQRSLHPDDRDEMVALDALHNASAEPYHAEYRMVGRDGREIWVRDDAVILRGEAGSPNLWQGVMVDVTERKNTELQLRARAAQQEVVADLGRLALTGLDVPGLMDRAVDLVCDTLAVAHCELLELSEGDELVMRAGRGWSEGVIGAVVAAGRSGLPGFTLTRNEPVVVEDLAADDRFSEKSWLLGHGVVGGISVIVRGPQQPWGVLAVLSTEPRSFPSDDVYFLRSVANVLAMAIQRANADEQRAAVLANEQLARREAERARERLRFLAEASSILSSSLDYEATLSRLAHLAVPEMSDWCIVYRLTESGEMRRLTVAFADTDRALAAQELEDGVRLDPEADAGVPKVIRTGQPILHTDADPALVASDSSEPDVAMRIATDLGVCSWMCVPLNARGRTIGAMSFLSAESGRRFGEEDLSLAMELARHAALAVDNAYLYEAELDARRATERAAQRTALLQAVTAALSEALGPTEVAEIVVDRCVAAMGASAGVVALLTPDEKELEIIRVVGYRPEVGQQWARFPVDARLPMSDAVRTEEPVFLTSRADRDARYPQFASTPMENEAVATVPLVVESRAIGGMALSFAEQRPFPPEDRAFLLALARQAAQALERSRLYQAERNARAEAERAGDRLAFLAEASEILSRSLDYRETLAEVTRLAVPRLADWCSIEMLEDGEIVSVAVAHKDPEKVKLAQDLRKRYPPNVDDPTGVPNVIRTGQPELWPDISEELIAESVEDPEVRQLLHDLRLRSLMIVPLKSRGRPVGAITFVWSESGRTYGAADLALAQDLARRGAQAVENAMIYRERDYIARTLQQSLLPPDLPEIPGIELAARYLPAGAGNEVGGDFYDIFDTGDGAWGLAIGDVCGKGPDAAAVMGLAKYSLRAAAMRERRPSRILETVNEAVMNQTTDGRFLTVAYARIRPDERSVRLTVSCGGHPLPTVMRADGSMITAGKPGTLLGLFPDPELSDDTVDLTAGDLMIVYTDGVTDSPGFEEASGERRLAEVLAGCVGKPAAEIADTIEREVLAPRTEARRDDVAFVILRVLP